jgi:hypothetical protein
MDIKNQMYINVYVYIYMHNANVAYRDAELSIQALFWKRYEIKCHNRSSKRLCRLDVRICSSLRIAVFRTSKVFLFFFFHGTTDHCAPRSPVLPSFVILIDTPKDSLDGGSPRRKVSVCAGKRKHGRQKSTSVLQVEFETVIPFFWRLMKTIHALVCTASVISVLEVTKE